MPEVELARLVWELLGDGVLLRVSIVLVVGWGALYASDGSEGGGVAASC